MHVNESLLYNMNFTVKIILFLSVANDKICACTSCIVEPPNNEILLFSSGPTYIELQTDYVIHNCIRWQRRIGASFCGLGKSVFLRNRSRYFRGVCYNSTHDHRSPGKPIHFGSWIYPGFRGQSHMETPRNWTFVIG